MSDREGVISSEQSPHGTHTLACEQSHENLQLHADNAQRLTVDSPQADLLRWHYRLGHLSFKLIKAMAEVGLLPKKLAKAPIPKFAGCMFAALTKKPWRTKGRNNGGQVGSAHLNTPSFRSSSGTLRCQSFAAMVEHRSTASKTLLRSEHVVTDDESISSEGASEGDNDEND